MKVQVRILLSAQFIMSRHKQHKFTFVCIDRWSNNKNAILRIVKSSWFDSAERYIALGMQPPGAKLFRVVCITIFR